MATIKAFVDGVPMEPAVWDQLEKLKSLSFVDRIALMPDAHVGKGSTVGTVVGTVGAIIPACVGVDIGCGMMAVRTSLVASDLPASLKKMSEDISEAVPTGGPGVYGSWTEPGRDVPLDVISQWTSIEKRLDRLSEKYPRLIQSLLMPGVTQLGTLGTGNHFIELCLDESDSVWVMLHSGSRGLGNRIGTYFIERAKDEMRRWHINLPDEDLSYLSEGSEFYDDYIEAVDIAQEYARVNRRIMMSRTLAAVRKSTRQFGPIDKVVSCHHNYISWEIHFGKGMWVTRKGAVLAGLGDLGIIPSSMGTPSFITRGLGNPDSLNSSSHGTGRVMSRTEAKKRISLDRHAEATKGIECDKSGMTIDESPDAYKPADLVMAAQRDLVSIEFRLRQVLNVKGVKEGRAFGRN